MIDLYCERIDSGLWAEPVNAFTNICFILAAWFSWRIAARERTQDLSVGVIIGLIVTIAIGSLLFHLMATSFTRWLDIIPIFAFQLLYIGLYTRRVMHLPWVVSGTLLFMFLIAAVYAGQYSEIINGSLIYFPAWLVIFVLGWYHYQSQKLEPSLVFAAATLFLLSIFFRSIDNMICTRFVLGTHFLWHILNALVIYLAMRALIANLSCRPNSD